MKHRGCAYRGGVRGRSFTTRPGVGTPTSTAHLKCSRCAKSGQLACRSDATPRHLDQKFRHAGWALDPHICPDCQTAPAKEKTMASSPKPSMAAMKAQTAMFRLLSDHFDIDKGVYDVGWSDQRIATDTGMAPDAVIEFRRAGFGEIKEAPEIASLRADIRSLEQLSREHIDTVTRELAALRGRVMKITGATA